MDIEVKNMDDRELLQETMAQMREVAEAQIRIEGKLDLISQDYNSKIDALRAEHRADIQSVKVEVSIIRDEFKELKEQRNWLKKTIIGQAIAIIVGAIAVYLGLKR